MRIESLSKSITMFLLYYSLNLSVYQFSSLNNWYRSHFVLWNLLTASLSISAMHLLTHDNNVYKSLRLICLRKGEDNFKQQSDGRRGENILARVDIHHNDRLGQHLNAKIPQF